MKAYAAALGVVDYVTFAELVPISRCTRCKTADVCINPDGANEMNEKSTMNKIMEYMALGKPVVQFDLTEGRFSAQEASLYAEKNNELDLARKIVQLLDDPGARAKMGAFGRNRVENELEWKYEVPRLLRAYEVAFARR